jgi:phenylpropionate dioxygenase-like ring-hydroxylating dioxygenase large terminal subunit
MRRAEYINLVERLLAHIHNDTTDSAPSVDTIPVANYTNPERWQKEMDNIFRRVPLMLAFTFEIAEAGAFKTMEVLGTPVLISRDEEGVARAFLNVCVHRGGCVVSAEQGRCERFVCPYHGWAYDLAGKLNFVADRAKFGELDTADMGLTALPCVEAAGMVFVCLSPGASIDLEDWLGEMLDELAVFDIASWHLFDRKVLPTVNWKACYDGYLEGYHFRTTHTESLYPTYRNNVMTFDAYGPHQRIGFPAHAITALEAKPKDEWETSTGLAVIRTLFPNVSFAISPGGGMVSQLLPGPTPDRSTTIQNFVYRDVPKTPEEIAMAEIGRDVFHAAVRDEDNPMVAGIQRGLHSGAVDTFVFGRNELGNQRFHRWVDYYLQDQPNPADRLRVGAILQRD